MLRFLLAVRGSRISLTHHLTLSIIHPSTHPPSTPWPVGGFGCSLSRQCILVAPLVLRACHVPSRVASDGHLLSQLSQKHFVLDGECDSRAAHLRSARQPSRRPSSANPQYMTDHGREQREPAWANDEVHAAAGDDRALVSTCLQRSADGCSFAATCTHHTSRLHGHTHSLIQPHNHPPPTSPHHHHHHHHYTPLLDTTAPRKRGWNPSAHPTRPANRPRHGARPRSCLFSRHSLPSASFVTSLVHQSSCLRRQACHLSLGLCHRPRWDIICTKSSGPRPLQLPCVLPRPLSIPLPRLSSLVSGLCPRPSHTTATGRA